MSSAELSFRTLAVPDGAPTAEELSVRLPDYENFQCIGTGAMGVVYAAHHKPLDRLVAVKVLSPALLGQALTVRRFFQEARAMARISHPNIVPVYEVGGEGALPYFAMELVNGGSLKDKLCGGPPLPPREAAQIAGDLSQALAHAHELGVLHRDVKPANVLLDSRGAGKLADFGLVRHADGATLTATDAIVGTPQYMSPEQVRSDALDGRSDQFSLGVSLYEMLTGRAPFRSDSPVGVLRAICDAEPPSIHKLRPEIPQSLEAVVMRMLEKDPERRYPHMRAVAADLDRYLRGEAVEATLPSGLARGWRRLRSNTLAWRFAVAAAIAVLVAGIYIADNFFLQRNLQIDRQQQARQDIMQDAGRVLALDPQSAARTLEQLDEQGKQQHEALLLRARAAAGLQDFPAALGLIEQEVLPRWPADHRSLIVATQIALDAREFGKARNWLARLEALEAPGAEAARETLLLGLSFRRRFADADLEEAAAGVAAQRADSLRARARLNLNNAARKIEDNQQLLNSAEMLREQALLSWLEARTIESPRPRIEGLLAAHERVTQLIALDFLDREAVHAAMNLQEEIAKMAPLGASALGEGNFQKVQEIILTSERSRERYEIYLQAGAKAMSWVQQELGRSQPAETAPPAAQEPLKGPLGRIGDGVGALWRGVFGGQ